MSIPQVDFPPLGRTIPQVGLGCGRLVGRSGLRASAKIVEAALDAGIRYFDVAPSYGMGTAEEVLGAVLGDSSDVVVATKVGIPRPPYSAKRARLRRWLKPVLDRSRPLKTFARRFYAPPPAGDAAPVERDFSEATVLAALEDSLARLKRSRIDVYLAHEPGPGQLDLNLAARFDRLRESGRIGAFGAGVDVRQDRPAPFGSVWQSGWPGENAPAYRHDVAYVFHGVIRYAPKDGSGRTVVPPSRLLRDAVLAAPGALLLVSASTPDRLRDLLSDLPG